MKLEKRLPKFLNLPRKPSKKSFESATRAISPISNSEGSNLIARNSDSFRSHFVSRNITPIDAIDNKYYFAESPERPKLALKSCNHCKSLEKEIENYKKTVNSLKEKNSSNEKHLKQYESLLLIKENRLKERENSLNDQIENFHKNLPTIQLTKPITKSIKTQSSQVNFQKLIQNSTITLNSESSTQTVLNLQIKRQNSLFIKQVNQLTLRKFKPCNPLFIETASNLFIQGRNLQKLDLEKYSQTEEMILNIKNRRSSLKLSHENTIGTTRHASNKSSPDRNSSIFPDSILKDGQIFRSPQEVSSNLKISGFKAIEDQDVEYSFNQMSISGASIDGFEGLTPIRKNSFLNKDEILGKSFKELTNFDQKLIDPDSLPQSRDEPVQKLSIVSRLKAKLQQNAYEAEQQVKLKEFFYQQENEKFMNKIQQFETFNQILSRENIDLKEKSKTLSKELEELQCEKEKICESFKMADEEISQLKQKLETLSEENSKLEDLNEKLKARLLIYKNKRTQDGSDVQNQELDDLIQTMHEKLLTLQEKEEELNEIRRQLSQDYEINTNNAECLKILFQDLSQEKLDLKSSKEDFNLQKSSIIDIEKSHHQRILLLNLKESELFKFREELIEKERLLSAHYYRSPSRAFKRMNTQLGELNKSPSDTF